MHTRVGGEAYLRSSLKVCAWPEKKGRHRMGLQQ
jgi:hypothetical protein